MEMFKLNFQKVCKFGLGTIIVCNLFCSLVKHFQNHFEYYVKFNKCKVKDKDIFLAQF